MAYSYSGLTKQLGLPHTNVIVAVKVEPGSSEPAKLLASTRADSNGRFHLVWTGWAGRVSIGHLDDDGAVKLNPKFADYQVTTLASDRTSAIERLIPSFLYRLDEEAGPYANVMAPVPLEVKAGWTAPSVGQHRNVMGDYLALPSIQSNSDLSMQEVNAGSGDGYGWLGDCTLFAVVRTGAIGTPAHLMQFRDQGETSADNNRWSLYFSAGGQWQLFWKYGAGSNVSVYFTTPAVANTDYVVIASRNVTTKEVTWWVNGVKEVVGYATNPDGGANGVFMLFGQNHTTAAAGWLGKAGPIGGFGRQITDYEANVIYRSAKTPYANAVMALDAVAGFWPMDETAGTIIYDHGPNGYDGTYESVAFGSLAAPPGLGGNGVTLDGIASGLDFGWISYDRDDPLVMGAWLNVRDFTSGDRFLYLRTVDDVSRLTLEAAVTALKFKASLIATYVIAEEVGVWRNDLWMHLAVSWDPITRKLQQFINGVWVNTIDCHYILHTSDYQFLIGRNGGSSVFGEGDVRGAFIANSRVDASDMLALYSSSYDRAVLEADLAVGLLAHYTFHNYTTFPNGHLDELFDETDNNFDGFTTWGSSSIRTPGRFGDDLVHGSAGSSKLTLPDLGAGVGLPTFTMTMWFKQPASDHDGGLVAQWGNATSRRCFRLYHENSAPKRFYLQVSPDGADRADERANFEGDFDDNQWHFLVCKFSASSVQAIKIDDGDWQHAPTPSTMQQSTYAWFLFEANWNQTQDWAGQLEDLRIYNVLKTDDEIRQIQTKFKHI